MESYLNRALKNDVTDVQLMNVIRIILHLPITNHGAGGEEHYLTVAMNKRNAEKNRNKTNEIEFVEREVDEDQEVEEIAALFEQNL